MSRTVYTFPDAKAAVAALCTTAMVEHPESYTVGAQVTDRVPTADTVPAILLGVDLRRHGLAGQATGWGEPVIATVTVRVSVWHADADQAADLAALLQGYLLANTGPDIDSITPGLGPVPAVDTTSMAVESFTVLAVMKARALA